MGFTLICIVVFIVGLVMGYALQKGAKAGALIDPATILQFAKIAEHFVDAAEQSLEPGEDGDLTKFKQEKYAWVLDQMQQAAPRLNFSLVHALIEAAVRKLKQAPQPQPQILPVPEHIQWLDEQLRRDC